MDSNQESATFPPLSAVLVGDELGLIKRLELSGSPGSSSEPLIVNRDLLDRPSPDQSVLTIRRFRQPHYELTSGQADTNWYDQQLFLVCSKQNRLQIYNEADNRLQDVQVNQQQAGRKLVGALPFHQQHVICCYEDGGIYLQSIENQLLELTAEHNRKALKVLGLSENAKNSGDPKASLEESTGAGVTDKADVTADEGTQTGDEEEQPKAKQNDQPCKKSKKNRCHMEFPQFAKKHKSTHKSLLIDREVYSPGFNASNTTLDCFELQGQILAISGRNNDLRLFDLDTAKCIFTAKPPPADWLGLRKPIWISGISWLGNQNPTMLAACSRTEPVVRIYDHRADGKAVMVLDLKDKGSYHPNPPAFTTMSSTHNIFNQSNQVHQLLIGSNVGRLIAVDFRVNSQIYQTTGAFKGFSGSVRDIKHVPESARAGKVLTCCLDRFVRVHEFSNNGFEKSKELKAKYYMKTRLVCLQPIFNHSRQQSEHSADE